MQPQRNSTDCRRQYAFRYLVNLFDEAIRGEQLSRVRASLVDGTWFDWWGRASDTIDGEVISRRSLVHDNGDKRPCSR